MTIIIYVIAILVIGFFAGLVFFVHGDDEWRFLCSEK